MRTTTTRLGAIAEVSIGVVFRARIESSPTGNVRVIQMKDLKGDLVRLDQTVRVHHSKVRQAQFARIGDLIFRSRGQTYTAALVNQQVTDVIVAAPLWHIRPYTAKVLPEYLCWWINQPSSQRHFASRAEGSFVRMISRRSVADLEVCLPPMRQQRKIAQLYSLFSREQQLLRQIQEQKALYANGVLMQMAKDPHPLRYTFNKSPRYDLEIGRYKQLDGIKEKMSGWQDKITNPIEDDEDGS